MPKLKPETVVPDQRDEAAINAGIAQDADNPQWSDADFAGAVPAAAFFSTEVMTQLTALKRRQGERGAQRSPTKRRISIRLSQDVLDSFRATGDGWQTRIDDALRDHVAKRARGMRASK